MSQKHTYARARPGAESRRGIRTITRETDGVSVRNRRDVLATEEPLEIRVGGAASAQLPASVTMRTPGSDFELAAGFLFGEGILDLARPPRQIRYCTGPGVDEQRYNVVTVELSPGHVPDLEPLRRTSYLSSSCGVCGKASIEAVFGAGCNAVPTDLRISPDTLLALPERLRAAQRVFERTGGLHAAAEFDVAGKLLGVREDVGRHNAMDKLIGAALLTGRLPLTESIVLVSGRLSFELVQKAARAGVQVLAAVSAPSSLAVQLAEEAGITLVGFLRDRSFNLYTAPDRVLSDI